jgi:hypothetical protein
MLIKSYKMTCYPYKRTKIHNGQMVLHTNISRHNMTCDFGCSSEMPSITSFNIEIRKVVLGGGGGGGGGGWWFEC